MMWRSALIAVGLLSLASCRFIAQPEDVGTPLRLEQHSSVNHGHVFHDETRGFDVTIADELSRWTTWSEGLNGPSYPHFTSEEPTPTVSATIFYSPAPCTPSLTGVSQSSSLPTANGTATAGRVDFWEMYPMGDFPDMLEPICRPPVTGAAYALCSEKDSKTVVICVSQVTDDPDLARSIFETFRWTE